MANIDDKAARSAIEHGITIFKFLKFHAGYIRDNAVATSALIQVLSDELPQLAEKYQERFDSLKTTAPISVAIGAMCDQVDRIVRELEPLTKDGS